MNTAPKQYVVYWTSKFNGKNPGYGTPMYQANLYSSDDLEAARKFFIRMIGLRLEEGTYRGRVVVQCAASFPLS